VLTDVNIFASLLKTALQKAEDNKLQSAEDYNKAIYQAFIDLFWQIANAKKVKRDYTIEGIASACIGTECTTIQKWK
jgi:hypothetical protein